MDRIHLAILRDLHIIRNPLEWAQPGVEYWLTPLAGVANSTGNWTVTGATQIGGSGGDFMKKDPAQADYGTPPHFLFDAAGELISSGAFFGDQRSMERAAELLHRDSPFKELYLKFFAKVDVMTGAETATSVAGFVEDGGSPAVAADHMASLRVTDSAFALASGAASVAAGAGDLLWHEWEIIVNRVTSEITLKKDGVYAVAPGSGLAVQANEWPAKFGSGVLASTGANFFKLAEAKIGYR